MTIVAVVAFLIMFLYDSDRWSDALLPGADVAAPHCSHLSGREAGVKSLRETIQQSGFSIFKVSCSHLDIIPKSQVEASVMQQSDSSVPDTALRPPSKFFGGVKITVPIALCVPLSSCHPQGRLDFSSTSAALVQVGYLIPDFALGQLIKTETGTRSAAAFPMSWI